jgi:hypothetical protein
MTTEQHANQPSAPVNPQAVEETKQQIRALVSEIAQLTRKEVAPEVFYAEFLQRVITALAAVGGAVWLLKDGHELRLTYQVNIRQAFPDDNQEDQARHGRLLQRVLQNGEQLLVPPYSGTAGEDEAGNPTSFLLVLAPIKDDDKVAGIVEIFQRPTSGPASQRGYLRFLSEMCQHVGDYIRSQRLQELNEWQTLYSEGDRFARAVHESLDPSTTAYTVANEGRRLIGCDRVSVALRKGRKCSIKAVSGQDTMDTRSNAVVMLGKLATAVMRSGEPLWYTGSSEDLPPQIENALHDYVDETHTKTVAVIPLRKPSEEVPDGDESKKKNRSTSDGDEVVGTLIVEQIEDSRAPEEFTQSVDLVCQHSARALANAMEHDSLFLMPLWRAIGKAKWILEARTLPKTFAVVAALGLLMAILCFYPKDFDMEAPGMLKPVDRRNVFVDVDGTVTTVHVQHGEQVTQGQLLVELTNPMLDTDRERLLTEIAQTETMINQNLRQRGSELTAVERNQLESGIAEFKSKLIGLGKQLALVQAQIGMLRITSPIGGQVVSWDVQDVLANRPLVRGDVAMTVADVAQEWEIEAFMEEDRMGHVARALPDNGDTLQVKYILKSDPKNQLSGTLAPGGIHDAAQLHDVHGHSVRLIVNLNEDDLNDPHYGNEVTIKVHCGRRSVGFVWFHELVEFLQSTVLF